MTKTATRIVDFGSPFRNRLAHSLSDWVPQMRSNLQDIYQNPVSHLVPEVERVGVAVAAGPSATKNVELLKGRGDVVVCAADRAGARFGRLFLRFYSCTSDPSPLVAKFYEDMPAPIAAVLPIQVHQTTVKALRDRKIPHYYYTPALRDDEDEEFKLLNKLLLDLTGAPLMYGVSDAGSLTFRTLIGLGCKRIGLVGYDYSEPYDSPIENWSLYPAYLDFMRRNNITDIEKMKAMIGVTDGIHSTYGTKYWSDNQWRSYRTRLYRLIEQAQKGGIEIYNCTEGGSLDADSLPCTTLAKFLNPTS